jgi:hypothetical protein
MFNKRISHWFSNFYKLQSICLLLNSILCYTQNNVAAGRDVSHTSYTHFFMGFEVFPHR